MMLGRLPDSRTLLSIVAGLCTLSTSAWAASVDPWIERGLREGTEQEFFVVLDSGADLKAAARSGSGVGTPRVQRTAGVRDALREHASRTQASLRDWLDRHGVSYTSYYIVNALLVRGDETLMRTLSARSDVARIEGNPRIRVAPPEPARQLAIARKALAAIEPGISATNAPTLWNQGHTGQGIVVGGQDTGVAWNHVALQNQYRGLNGASADHNYHWHDSIHGSIASTANPCGYDTQAPCDDSGHGTHTMGTAVGSDGGANQIGMAPGARWIACRNMDQGVGRPSTYLECFEWFLAPYPIGGTTAQGDPSRAPDVTVNSWGCPPSEGCSAATLQSAVEAQRAAGIMTIVSAGNGGPSCATIDDPPAIYDASYSVAAYSVATGAIAAFSSRGNVTVDGSNRPKPDITAPGVNIRSAIPGANNNSYASFNGTSMAGPHVAGAVALLWSALPELKGNVDLTEAALNDGASPVPIAGATCGTIGTPNAVWGHGLLNVSGALSAVPPMIDVAIAGTGSGSVTSAPAGIACGATCSASFGPASPVALTATPAGASVFSGWLGACTGTGTCTVPAGTGASVTATFAPSTAAPLRIDVDVNGSYDALTDGLMILRYLFGLSGQGIVNSAIGFGATVSDPSEVMTRLQDLRPLFDVDGNGQAEALTDGLMIIRYLFGLRGSALTTGTLGIGATRTTPGAIESHIVSLLP
jgi:subtilisin family serine protease